MSESSFRVNAREPSELSMLIAVVGSFAILLALTVAGLLFTTSSTTID